MIPKTVVPRREGMGKDAESRETFRCERRCLRRHLCPRRAWPRWSTCPEHPLLKQVIRETYERHAVVGAVCHGPVSLLNVKLSNGSYLVDGKSISSFTNEEEEGLRQGRCAVRFGNSPHQARRKISQGKALATVQHPGRQSRHRSKIQPPRKGSEKRSSNSWEPETTKRAIRRPFSPLL